VSLADDMRNSPSLQHGLPNRTLERMIRILEELDQIADRIWGVSSGPAWSWDSKKVGGHISATYESGGTMIREVWVVSVDGNVLKHELTP
jgi:hypothetical protein